MVYILFLGNDLAGNKVKVNPLVFYKPSVDPNMNFIQQEIPGLFPSCSVRAYAHRRRCRSALSDRSLS